MFMTRVKGLLVASLGLGLIASLSFLPWVPIDFDQMHDGIILLGAIAVRQGLEIPTDLAYVYGPAGPWFNSLFLNLGPSPMVGIRLAAALTIGLVVFFIADSGRIRHSRSPLTVRPAMMASAAWLLASDVWGGGSLRPWTSLQMDLGLALFLWMAQRAGACIETGRVVGSRIYLVASGSALGFAFLARPGIAVFCPDGSHPCGPLDSAAQARLLTQCRYRAWRLAGCAGPLL